MRSRTSSRPTPIDTATSPTTKKESHPPIVPPLTPTTERELRKSCSLLMMNPAPKTRERSATQPATRPMTSGSGVGGNSITRGEFEPTLPEMPRSPLPPRTMTESPIPHKPFATESVSSRSHTPPPRSFTNESFTRSHTPPPSAFNFAHTATARKLSASTESGVPMSGVRASQIEIRRVVKDFEPTLPTTIDRNSTFLIAKPTIVEVGGTRPRTAGTNSSRSWGELKAGSEGNGSIDEEDVNKRMSLFPRPRTAHGGESPEDHQQYPMPPLPGSVVRTGSGLKTEIVSEVLPMEKKSKKAGFVQFSAFFKATFRFGKRVRTQ
ncbi:hypothetical protein BZA77DRAFT_29368 [Pyronema omphalodes]|nr:hypothetical protein BZA77DRAFT_29368 [Pyronema omphalodes]